MTPSVVTHSKTGCDADGSEDSADARSEPGDDGSTGDDGGDAEDDAAGADAGRGEGFIDVYSPLQRVGGVHTRSTVEAPGGVQGGAFDPAAEPESLQLADLAACIQSIGNDSVMLRDVALANDVVRSLRRRSRRQRRAQPTTRPSTARRHTKKTTSSPP